MYCFKGSLPCTHTHTFLPADAYQRAQFHWFLPATHRPQLCHFNMHWAIEARDVSVLHSQLYDAFIVLVFLNFHTRPLVFST